MTLSFTSVTEVGTKDNVGFLDLLLTTFRRGFGVKGVELNDRLFVGSTVPLPETK